MAPDTVANRNPSDLADVIGEYAMADADQTRAAIAAAKRAFAEWSVSPIQRRADILDAVGSEILARKDEIGRLLAREEGKTLAEGVGETTRAGQIFKFFAGEALRLSGEKLPSVRPGVDVEITREPIGVIGLITPWNFPIAIPSWKIAPALAYGNTVVFKPAQWTPGCAWALAEILQKAGIPAGVFNLVAGSGAVVGDTIVNHPDVAAISFTGSVATGREIAKKASTRLAKVQLEMGSKNPLVVLDDADLPIAVNVAVQGAYYSTGQRCTASSRLIVTEGIHDRFVAALIEKLKSLKVDDAVVAGHRHRARGRAAAIAAGSGLHCDRSERRRQPGVWRRAARAQDRWLLSLAGALHRGHQRDAHFPRGDLRSRGLRAESEELRRGAGDRQRHRLWSFRRHRHHVAEARIAFQAPRPVPAW